MERADQEKLRIERDGKLHWYHWLLVIASLLLTFSVWHITKRQVDNSIGVRFDRESEQVIAIVRERMEKYEDSLWSGVSAIQAAGGDISYDSWLDFAESLRVRPETL